MISIKSVALSSLGVLAAGAVAAELAHQTLRVEVQNLRNARGGVGCGLFSSADGFPDTNSKALQVVYVPIQGKSAMCEFGNVPPGTYAVAVFHDENKNGKLDKNLIGIPKEGYGTSNDVRPAMSAPQFMPASFVLGTEKRTTLVVRMGY
jgi:uncharacterized protein (DUF2141 family)